MMRVVVLMTATLRHRCRVIRLYGPLMAQARLPPIRFREAPPDTHTETDWYVTVPVAFSPMKLPAPCC
jgi:hypothetical protein